jgi:hypothetical protein
VEVTFDYDVNDPRKMLSLQDVILDVFDIMVDWFVRR